MTARFVALLCGLSSIFNANARLVGENNGVRHLMRTAEDPVTSSLKIISPLEGAFVTAPVQLSIKINVQSGGAKLYKQLYSDLKICVEASRLPNTITTNCFPATASCTGLCDLEPGTYIVNAFFCKTDEDNRPTGDRYWKSLNVVVNVVSGEEINARVADFVQARRSKYRAGYDLSLVDWASQQQQQRPIEILKELEKNSVIHTGNASEELVLLIGVKTAVGTNFALRQAVRETWASKDALPRGAKVLFVGCRPLSRVEETYENQEKEVERRRLREAIMLEKMVYGDLLIDELDCDDSYLDLANKAKEFLHVAATQYSSAQYVMLADDDVYIRVDELVEHFTRLGPRTRYFSGEMPSVQYGRKDRPNRDKSLRYSLSEEQYPLSEFPPIAMGAYFFLSMDCAKFISKNRYRLRGLNGVDDITIPLWLLTIQVHVRHQNNLGYLRASPCNERYVALGDLSPLAFREVHSNVQEGRSFCHGFEHNLWIQQFGDGVQNGVYHVLPWFPEPLQFSFVSPKGNKTHLKQLTTIVSTRTNAGVKVSSLSTSETFLEYTHRVCAEARLSIPSAVGLASCAEIGERLIVELREFSQQASERN